MLNKYFLEALSLCWQSSSKTRHRHTQNAGKAIDEEKRTRRKKNEKGQIQLLSPLHLTKHLKSLMNILQYMAYCKVKYIHRLGVREWAEDTQFNIRGITHWTAPEFYTPNQTKQNIRIKWKIDYWNRKMERWTVRKKMYQNVIEVKRNKINVNCALEWRSLLEHFSVFIVIDLPSFFVVTIFLVEYVCAFVCEWWWRQWYTTWSNHHNAGLYIKHK